MSGTYSLAAQREEPDESSESSSEGAASRSAEAEEPAHEEGMYGIRPWVTIDTTKPERGLVSPKRPGRSNVTFGNVLTAIFTAPILVVYALCSGLAFLFFSPRLGKRLFSLGLYVVWPYGRVLQCDRAYVSDRERRLISASVLAEYDIDPSGGDDLGGQEPDDTLAAPPHSGVQADDDQKEPLVPDVLRFPHSDPPAPSTIPEKITFYCFCSPLLIVSHALYIVVSFLSIVALPAASLHALVLRRELKDVMVLHPGSGQALASRTPIALVSRAMSRRSFGQAYFGINILIINSLCICVVALVFAFMPENWILKNSTLVFVISLIAIVPLSYLIGESVSQLTQKTNYAIGALLNATFGSIIEIILYITALLEGQNKLVQMSLIGSIVGCLLLLPGLAMLVGGIRNKEMKINSSLGGVTGLQFICCTLVVFGPTIFYYLYNTPQTTCVGCTHYLARDLDAPRVDASYRCSRCQENMWVNLLTDDAYTKGARKLQYVSAVILFITYVLGLVFNFVTHSFYYKTDINLPPELKKLLKDEEKRVHARRQRKMVLGAEESKPSRFRGRRRARAGSDQGLPEDVADLLTDKVGEKLERSLLGGDEEEVGRASSGASSHTEEEANNEVEHDIGHDPVTGRRSSRAESLGSATAHRHRRQSLSAGTPKFTGDEEEDIGLLEEIGGDRRDEAVETYRRLSAMLHIQHRVADPEAKPETMSRLSKEIIRTEKELVDLVVEAREADEGISRSRPPSLPSHGQITVPDAGVRATPPAPHSRLSQEGHRKYSAQLSASLGQEDASEVEGNPHAPSHVWPMWMVICVLIAATVMIALISEGLVTALDPAIEAMGLSDEFAGLTFFAIVPALSEYINAAMFAAKNHLTLAMEIGRAVTLQTAYIQVPVLILASLFIKTDEPFTIVFNIFDFVVVFFAVFLQMVMAENKSHNWYKGAVLLMTYASILGIFFLKPVDELPLPEPEG